MKIAIRRYRSEVVFKTVLLLLTAATFLVPAYSPAQNGQKTFESPQQAVDALIAANKDNNVAGLNQILGPDASTLISSGDDTQDNKDRAHFVDMYEERHRLVPTGTDDRLWWLENPNGRCRSRLSKATAHGSLIPLKA